jgi:hypothetical protein
MNLKCNSLLSKKSFHALLTSLAIALPLATQAGFVVKDGEVVGSQFLTEDGDTGIIEEGGKIETSTGFGVSPTGAFTFLIIQNDGTVLTTGSSGIGIFATPGSFVTNNGLIQTSGNNAHGILTSGVASEPATVLNNGRILTSGATSDGIYSNVAGSTNINNGLIQVTGDGSFGMESLASNTSLSNHGIILASGLFARGISASATGAVITNSGTIIANSDPTSAAIQFQAANPILNLQRGSNIQGSVLLSQPGTLNVQKGLNLALTTTGATFTTITTEGAPYATSGNLIAVVDRTGFAMEVDILDDLTAVIMNNLGSQYCFDCNDCCDAYGFNNGWNIWVRGFGSYRERKSLHETVEYSNAFEGGLAGVELPLCSDWTFGLFGGGSYGNARVEHHAHVLKNSSGFGGLYLDGNICGNFARFAVSGGLLDQRSKRKVMNNTIAGGYEYAKTTLNSGFVAPELRIGREFCVLGMDFCASADVRYSGLFVDSYDEDGSETDFHVKSHTLHIITTSAELAAPISFKPCGSCMTVTPYVGLEGRYRLGKKTLHGKLLGHSVNFSDGSWDDLGIFFVGIRSCHNTDCGLSLMLDLEADFDNKKSSLIRGGLKAEMPF